MKNRQAEAIKGMSDRDILFHLYLTQVILFILSIGMGYFLFDNLREFNQLWNLHDINIMYYGVGSAVIVIGIDFTITQFFSKELYDDGGINEKVFQTRTIPHILILTIIIATVEEILFRGVLQTSFGLIIASLIFALLHFRYLTKWVLFIAVVLLSFLLGIIYEITDNLWITVISHFLIDFVSAIKIRIDFQRRNGEEVKTT